MVECSFKPDLLTKGGIVALPLCSYMGSITALHCGGPTALAAPHFNKPLTHSHKLSCDSTPTQARMIHCPAGI